MPYAVLEKQLKELPGEYLEDVSRYVQLLQYKIAVLGQSKEKKKGIIFGLAEGKYKIPDDINAYDDEIAEMFDEALAETDDNL